MGSELKVGDRVSIVRSKKRSLDCVVCFVSRSEVGVEYTEADVTKVGMFKLSATDIRRV